MLVYLVAALETLVYLGAVPVCVGFWLTTRGGLRVGLGAGAFERRFALRRARRAALGRKRRKKRGRGGARLVRNALPRMRVEGLSLRGELCLGDAAATALACGAIRGLAASLAAWADRVEVDVTPRFDSDAPSVRLRGMIRIRAGQIIIAAAHCGMEDIKGRIAQWTDTRWKAS